MLQMIPGGELKIPRTVAPILRGKISMTINSTPLKAHTRNAVTRALERGYSDKYTGAAAVAYTTVCDMDGLMRVKIAKDRALILDIPDENYEALEQIANDKWMPLMMLAAPEYLRHRSKDKVSIWNGRASYRKPQDIYRGAWVYVSGLDHKMIWEDLTTAIPSLLTNRERTRELAKLWKSGADITGECHVGRG
jgi:hypothetical protein